MRRAFVLAALLPAGVLVADSDSDTDTDDAYEANRGGCYCPVLPITSVAPGFWAFHCEVWDSCSHMPPNPPSCTGGPYGGLSVEPYTITYPQPCPCTPRGLNVRKRHKVKPRKDVDPVEFDLIDITGELPVGQGLSAAESHAPFFIKFETPDGKHNRYAKLFRLTISQTNKPDRNVALGYQSKKPKPNQTLIPGPPMPSRQLIKGETNVCTVDYDGVSYAIQFEGP